MNIPDSSCFQMGYYRMYSIFVTLHFPVQDYHYELNNSGCNDMQIAHELYSLFETNIQLIIAAFSLTACDNSDFSAFNLLDFRQKIT